jgi:long-subunit fatty acid transport protein
MARRMTGMAWISVVLAAAAASCPLAAQSLWLPASDPVGISRSGAGVAFGRSLEAASLNPALLVTLTDPRSAFLSVGMDQQSQQVTPQSNQFVYFSSDRNRVLPAFGLAWRLGDTLVWGLKLDEPFLKHGRLPTDVPARFNGLSLDLRTQRLEFQGAWAATPSFSLGLSAGFTQVAYKGETALRLRIPTRPAEAVSASNPSLGLVEVGVAEDATRMVGSFSLGFRWAMAPRWTLGGTYRAGLSGNLSLKPGLAGRPTSLVANDGFSSPPLGLETSATALLASVAPAPGQGDFELPGMATLGLRQRVNQVFTWEADVRYVQGANTRMPGLAGMTTPSGAVFAPVALPASQGGFGASVCGELSFGKNLTIRVGASLDPPHRRDVDVDALMNGTRSAAFSGGVGWAIWGGELNLGYQFRQTQDRESSRIDSAWSSVGYRTTGTIVRVEGQGHLWSIGYKMSF